LRGINVLGRDPLPIACDSGKITAWPGELDDSAVPCAQAHPPQPRALEECPEGSERHGYEFVAPLDATGHIDPELWSKYRQHCGVRRFRGAKEQVGRLVHKPGGSEHALWMFDYDETAEDDDEAGYPFASHTFRPGEYVSVRDEGGGLHTFQVVTVEPAASKSGALSCKRLAYRPQDRRDAARSSSTQEKIAAICCEQLTECCAACTISPL
jgi:hypothetical protein